MSNTRNQHGVDRRSPRIYQNGGKLVSIFFWSLWLCFYILGHSGMVSSTPITNFKLGSNEDFTGTYSVDPHFRDPATSAWNRSNAYQDENKETQQSQAQSWNFDPRKDDSLNWENKIGTDDRRVDFTSGIVEVIVYIVLGLVVLSFIGFLVCICCPICVLAKIRHRRRGHVYSRQTAGVSSATTALTHPQRPQVIPIPNQRSSAPYPVQESITVIPLVQLPVPRYVPVPYSVGGVNDLQHGTYGSQPPPPAYIQGENVMKTSPVEASELPPPYPGLPTVDANSGFQQQPPYNPYYGGDQNPQWPTSGEFPLPDVANK